MRLECSGAILAHCILCLPGSSNSLTLASQVAEIIGPCRHTELICGFLVKTALHYVGQDSLDLLISWYAHLGLPKWWDYRPQPLCLTCFSNIFNIFVILSFLIFYTSLCSQFNWVLFNLFLVFKIIHQFLIFLKIFYFCSNDIALF